MNEIDKNPDYKKMYAFVVDLFKSSENFWYGPYDETYYTLRVFESCKNLISLCDEKVCVSLILVASILHDAGKAKLDFSKIRSSSGKLSTAKEEWNRHPALGVPVVKDFLKSMGHSDDFIRDVCFLVEHHDSRESDIKKSVELKILQDADLIADSGLAGFIRPFLFAGKFKRSVLDTFRYVKKEMAEENRIDLLNLDISKKLFNECFVIEKNFFDQICVDLDDELLN